MIEFWKTLDPQIVKSVKQTYRMVEEGTDMGIRELDLKVFIKNKICTF